VSEKHLKISYLTALTIINDIHVNQSYRFWNTSLYKIWFPSTHFFLLRCSVMWTIAHLVSTVTRQPKSWFQCPKQLLISKF